MLLHDVIDQFARKLTLQLNVKDLDENHIDNLHHLLTTNTGSQSLSVMVFEPKEKVSLTMPSRRLKVNINTELLDWLEEKQVYYKLN